MRIIKLDESSKKNILNDLLKRSPNNYDNFADSVNAILANVKENGDKALFQYTKDFDKADINASNIKVTEEEIKEAYDRLENPELVQVIRRSLKNIKEYHEKQKQYSWFDSKPEGNTIIKSWCLRTWWKSSLSIICFDECYSCKGCRC